MTAGPPQERDEADEAEEPIAEEPIAEDPVAAAGRGAAPVARDRLLPSATPRLAKVLYEGPDGRIASLIPRALRVSVTLAGARARTVLDLVFENPIDATLEGTFHYALPAGATPAGFAMFRDARALGDLAADGELLAPASVTPSLEPEAPTIDDAVWGDTQVARVVAQRDARRVYESIVRQSIDPALLEWSGANTYRARVFPIPPRSLKRVVLAYEETVPRHGAALVYRFALADDADLAAAAFEVVPPSGCALEVRHEDGRPIAVTHGTTASGARATRFEVPAQDTVIELRRPTSRAIDLVRGPAGALDGNCIHLRVCPEIPVELDPDPARRAVFVLDTSRSVDGVSQRFAARMLLEILARDDALAHYKVLLFDLEPRWLHEAGWRRNDAAARAATEAELGRIFAEGATDLDAALAALDDPAAGLDDGRPTAIFLLSDGIATWGTDDVETLLAAHPVIRRHRWHAYRFGDVAANLELFAGLARVSGGHVVHVVHADQIPVLATAHRQRSVRLAAVRVDGGATDVVVVGDPAHVYPGQELAIVGRLPGRGATHVHVDLDVGGERRVQSWPIPSGDDGLAARAWADHFSARLIARDDPALDELIVALSQAYGLANARASFLVLDQEDDWERHRLAPASLAAARRSVVDDAERERRRLERVGLSLTGIDGPRGELLGRLAMLDFSGLRPPVSMLPDHPFAGGEVRVADEREYRSRLAENPLDAEVPLDAARRRLGHGDAAGGLRALSTIVEMRPAHAESARLVGYACLALERFEDARRLFERVRVRRSFEPQSYLEEALALEATARFAEAARNYEIVLAREFPRHQLDAAIVARVRYAALLARLERLGLLPESGATRLGELRREALEAAAALRSATTLPPLPDRAMPPWQLTLFWNTDGVDIDLWVQEPERARVSYASQTSPSGGVLYGDVTDGYGPELYHRFGAAVGRFEVLAHYFGNASARFVVPTAVLLVEERSPLGERAAAPRYRLQLLGREEAIVALLETDPATPR